MPETKFTGGKWYVKEESGVPYVDTDLFGQFDGPIARCDYAHNSQWRANAHLIAAAPDLYAALVMAQQYIGDCNDPLVLGMVKAALKKAKGE